MIYLRFEAADAIDCVPTGQILLCRDSIHAVR
jgi:hypothetical protein